MSELNHTFVVLAYKESPYLEECIESVLHQTVKSKVIIGTSTPCEYISNYAEKYGLEIVENSIHGGGNAVDFDFAWNAGKTELVTIAHQDDVYDPTYAEEVIEKYEKYPDATIIVTDYFEIREGKRVYHNRNLDIKKMLLTPLRMTSLAHLKHVKRSALSLGNAICCPAVTFVKPNIPFDSIFVDPDNTLKGNQDWLGWLKLANSKGRFVFIPHPLMGHRVHDDTNTSWEIKAHTRSPQDLIMLKKFWPAPIAEVINKFYQKSEDSNNV
ncbi:MAG: glycosyltransferase family 2 protein [Erysipelotrichaceae bacterium]|nr:glycosyltransferase family 2 protein [Erysipelotrichaceae bacterium]